MSARKPTKKQKTQLVIDEIKQMKDVITKTAADMKTKMEIVLSKDVISSTAP